MAGKKLKILVLAGGESGERQVSLDSSHAIARALVGAGHEVSVMDAIDGKTLGPDFLESDGHTTREAYALPAKSEINQQALAQALLKAKAEGIDCVFNGLHGGAGENGAISALLEFVGLPYTGSPMAASAVAMNKDITKRVMWSLNIPTPKWHPYYRHLRTVEQICESIAGEFEIPMIIKPADCGSTVGLSLVEAAGEIPKAVADAFSASDVIIGETYFKGREITIAVLDGKALAPVEIKPTHKLYDYACKYTKGKSQYFCPADISSDIVAKLSDDAVRLYNIIGCLGYARVDFIVADGDHYICLELNTLPGMTELSLFPMAAKHAGMSFPDLLVELCRLGMERK